MSKTLRNTMLLVVVLLGYLYVSPYIVLYQIKTAIDKGDSEKISGYIDFDSLKHSLKQQISTLTVQYFKKNNLDQRWADEFTKTQMRSGSELNRMIDRVVSPSGVQSLFAVQQQKQPSSANHSSASGGEQVALSDDYSTSYQSWDWFNVQFNHPKFQDQTLLVKMQRDGFSWQIKAAEIMDKQ